MNESDTLERRIASSTADYQIPCDEARCAMLAKHLRLVTEKNRELNLTRITDENDAVLKHVIDSLLPLACNQTIFSKDAHALDIGTGAGFPGIPLAICTECHWTLVDSVRKKAEAVQGFVNELGLAARVRVLASRSEELARAERESFDIVVARAVADSSALIEYATPLMKMKGQLVLYKGRPEQAEIERANAAAEICGLRLVSRETFQIETEQREVLIFEKHDPAKISLPRREGMAVKKPLAK